MSRLTINAEQLPNAEPLFRGKVHLILLGNAEGFVPLREVSGRHIRPQNIGGMNIVGKSQLQKLILRFHAPDSRPVFKVGLEVRIGERVQKFEGRGHAAVVSNVFADNKLPVDASAVNFNAVKLPDHLLCQFLEGFKIFLRPPVFQITAFIKIRAVIVKGVGNFMGDDCANAAEIFADALSERIEGLLQNGGREVISLILGS